MRIEFRDLRGITNMERNRHQTIRRQTENLLDFLSDKNHCEILRQAGMNRLCRAEKSPLDSTRSMFRRVFFLTEIS